MLKLTKMTPEIQKRQKCQIINGYIPLSAPTPYA